MKKKIHYISLETRQLLGDMYCVIDVSMGWFKLFIDRRACTFCPALRIIRGRPWARRSYRSRRKVHVLMSRRVKAHNHENVPSAIDIWPTIIVISLTFNYRKHR